MRQDTLTLFCVRNFEMVVFTALDVRAFSGFYPSCSQCLRRVFIASTSRPTRSRSDSKYLQCMRPRSRQEFWLIINSGVFATSAGRVGSCGSRERWSTGTAWPSLPGRQMTVAVKTSSYSERASMSFLVHLQLTCTGERCTKRNRIQ